MAITSQIRNPLGFASLAVRGWQAAGLLKPSVLKPVFATIEQILIVRTLGQFNETDRDQLRQSIDACFE
jgi:mRNA interferase MazF